VSRDIKIYVEIEEIGMIDTPVRHQGKTTFQELPGAVPVNIITRRLLFIGQLILEIDGTGKIRQFEKPGPIIRPQRVIKKKREEKKKKYKRK
jgi:hypothetical protein